MTEQLFPVFYSIEGDHIFFDFRKLHEKPQDARDLDRILGIILSSLGLRGRLFLLRYNRETKKTDGIYSNNLSPHHNRTLTQGELSEMEPHITEFLLKKAFSNDIDHLIDLSEQALYSRIFEDITQDLLYQEKVFSTYKKRLDKEGTVKEKTVFLSSLSHSLTQKGMDDQLRQQLLHRLQLEIYKPHHTEK